MTGQYLVTYKVAPKGTRMEALVQVKKQQAVVFADSGREAMELVASLKVPCMKVFVLTSRPTDERHPNIMFLD